MQAESHFTTFSVDAMRASGQALADSRICRDVLAGLNAKVVREGRKELEATVDEVLERHLKQAQATQGGSG